MQLNNKSLIIVCSVIIIVYCAAMIRISDIKKRPREFHDKRITLSGYVDNVVTLPILSVGVYQIDDGTGKIWVKPAGDAPYQGQHVRVTGVLKVGLTISGKTFGLILIEEKKS